ncbi:hypothetical protein [Sphingorhabdus lutea]|nr:hypothetical protein [Sphingorhabdus lutea]
MRLLKIWAIWPPNLTPPAFILWAIIFMMMTDNIDYPKCAG